MKPLDYKDEEFIHFIYKGREKEEAIEIPFEEIERLNLNKKGKAIPYAMNNVVNLERYMLWYWQPIIGGDAIILFLNLWEYCDRNKGIDLCYPKISELTWKMGKSANTIRNLLKKLEDNNFILTIHRINKMNKRETSPVFKLRQTVPLLSREQYYLLNEKLQLKHDEYVEKFVNDPEFKMDMFNHDVNETIEYLKLKGDKIISSKAREEIKSILKSEEQQEYLLNHIPSSLKDSFLNSHELKEHLINKGGFSKPMTDIYFDGCMSLYDKRNLQVYVLTKEKSQSDFLKEAFETNQFQFERLNKFFTTIYGEEQGLFKITYISLENFIYKILKGI